MKLIDPIEDTPPRIAALPKCPTRNVPVPWFVAWIDGVPEFRVADGDKRVLAVRQKLCWVCGDKLGRFMTFVLGPMCGVNRTTTEPPCHLECARYSARACPFLSKPQMVRREGGVPEDAACDGHMIRRNPGVTLLWTTKSYSLFDDGAGGFLFRVGEPESLEWWALGQAATRAQVEESVRTGVPLLMELAVKGGQVAMRQLTGMINDFTKLYPKE